MLSLFCGFPLGHNGNSAVRHQTLICYLMPVSLKNKNSVHYSSRVPPPRNTAQLQNMQTDRASLDSPVCVPAYDASPQLQTKSVSPTHNSSCGLIQGSSVCKLSQQRRHQHNTQCTQPKYLQCSHSAAGVNTQRKNLPCMKLELQLMKTRRLWLVDPVTHPGLYTLEKKEAV